MARRRILIISELGKVACNIDAIRQLLEVDEGEYYFICKYNLIKKYYVV